MNKFITFILAAVLISLVVGCDPQAQNQVQGLQQKVEQAGLGIVAPDGLLSCPEEMVANHLSEELEKTCFTKTEPHCSYYKTIKDGVEKIHNLQFTSECNLCRNHKQKGVQFHENNGEVYIHLGYKKEPCYQGMYKTK